MKKNIIVTGGAGFVGSHACKELYKSEFNPIVIDNLSNGFKHNVKWGPLEICDIKDEKKLIKVFNKYNPIAVIHFAANAYVGESMENPKKIKEKSKEIPGKNPGKKHKNPGKIPEKTGKTQENLMIIILLGHYLY